MILTKACLFLFCSMFVFLQEAGAQEDSSAKLYDFAARAGDMYARKAYDSALVNFFKGLELVQSYNLYKDVIASVILDGIGDCYYKKADARQSHRYYMMALQNARKYAQDAEKEIALWSLFNLHQEIIDKNLAFDYPAVAETEEDDLFTPLGKTEEAGDSLKITILSGKYDGIAGSTKNADIYTHITPQDTIRHNDISYYGTGRIIRLDNNTTVVKVKKDPATQLLPGDFAIIRAGVPLQWRKLSFRSFLLQNLSFRDNYKQALLNYRFFYYFNDSLLEKDVLGMMKTSVKEVAETFAGDTLTNPAWAQKSTAGIFAGRSLMKAMLETEPEHLRYFLHFVARFPGKYIGNNYKFSETYATWIINNTLFDPEDIRQYLLGFPAGETRQQKAFYIRDQVRQENLIDKWLDEGMRQVNIENIAVAGETAGLIFDATTGTGDTSNVGWSDYLFANIEKRMSNSGQADSFLQVAMGKFLKTGNKEGQSWIGSTREQWKKNSRIIVGVQNGHLFPFVIAESRDSRYFATGGQDNLVKIWDKTLGKEILTINEHKGEINSLNYSPNGRYLVSSSADSTICIWNAYNYSLLHKFVTARPVRTAIFSPDSKWLVCAGEDSIIRFRDIQTGGIKKTLRFHKGIVYDLCFDPLVPTWLYSGGADSMIYKWDIETGEMIRWYRQKGKVLALNLSKNGRYMSTISTDSNFTIWNTYTHKKILFGKINTYKVGSTDTYSTGSFSPDSKYFVYPFARDSFNVVEIANLYQRVYGTRQRDYNLADMLFSKDGVSLFARFDLGGPLRLYNFAGWDIRDNTTLTWKDIKPFANLTTGVQFTHDDNGLVIQHSEVGKIDLRNASYERLFYGGGIIENPYLILNDERLGTYFESAKPVLNLYDYTKKEITKQFILPGNGKLSAYELSPDNHYCFLGSESGEIGGWDMLSGKNLFIKKYTKGKYPEISHLAYDPYKKRLFAVTRQNAVLVVDPGNGDTTGHIRGEVANYITASPGFIYITSDDGFLYKHEAVSLALIKKIRINEKGEGAYQLVLSPDQKYLLLQNTFSSLMAMDTETDSVLYAIRDHDFGGSMIAVSHDSRKIATAGFDSKINLMDITNGKRIVAINMPMERGPVMVDEEGNYLASKNALDAVIFSYNNNAYSFDQFDIQLNRPDIILKEIGRADSVLLKTYYLAYRKRLKRLNIDEKDITGEVHQPLVRLRDKYAVQPVTTQKEYSLTIECSDSRYPLESLQVLVNNSPLLGIGGRDLHAFNTQQTVQVVSVPLSEGENDIKVYCTNNRGVSSLKESFNIMSKYRPEKPAKTYFIGIAVAHYKDPGMNLGYSVKDVRDLAKTFGSLYKNTHFDTLIDANATRENILAIKKKLMQTTVNDRVILAVTGHGLLSDSLDFYYATWDIDFKKPADRGLKYDDLENLLTDIPARQKLMLIDACHSGALDKDELLALEREPVAPSLVNKNKPNPVKAIGSRGLIIRNKEGKMSANSSFEMMQNLFSDLAASNGAVIISAAGGMEYAFESGKWNNGVFTYCVRKGIEENQADTDGGNDDGKVSVQELLKYVSRKVSELTDGKQKPTSRRENVDYEWMLD